MVNLYGAQPDLLDRWVQHKRYAATRIQSTYVCIVRKSDHW